MTLALRRILLVIATGRRRAGFLSGLWRRRCISSSSRAQVVLGMTSAAPVHLLAATAAVGSALRLGEVLGGAALAASARSRVPKSACGSAPPPSSSLSGLSSLLTLFVIVSNTCRSPRGYRFADPWPVRSADSGRGVRGILSGPSRRAADPSSCPAWSYRRCGDPLIARGTSLPS